MGNIMTHNTMILYTRLIEFLNAAVGDSVKNGMLLRKERFTGVFSKEDWSRESGLNMDVINAQIYAIENWSDFNLLPSVTALMRPVPETVHQLVISDIFTYLNNSRAGHMRVQRHLLEIGDLSGDGAGNTYLPVVFRQGVDVNMVGRISELTVGQGIPTVEENILERDRVVMMYSRLGYPADPVGQSVRTAPYIDW